MRALRAAALAASLSCSDAQEPPPGPGPGPQPGPALRVSVRGGEDLQPLPCRLIIRPVGETPRPSFRSDGHTTVEIAPGVLGDVEGVLLITGEATVPLPPGTYDVRAVQGPTRELAERRVVVTQEAAAPLDLVLERTVRTDGWLAADMHLHSGPRSHDSRLLAAHRVVSEVAAGIEVLVPTEHVNHNDLQPEIEALGYARRAVSIPGSEYGFREGHAGVYPVVFDPMGRFFGAPDWQKWPWHDIDALTYFPIMHALPGQPLVIINHPRLPPDLGYFHNIRWQPGAPLPTAGLFDGMEVLAGYEMAPQQVTALLRDWFYLLNQGHRVTGVGNSDTHRLDWLRAGFPRTWLRLPTEEPQRVLPGDLRAALLGMRAIASSGPFVTLRAEGRDIGETARPRGGKLRVEVEADAPAWIDLQRVQLYVSGALLRELPVTGRGHPALREVLELDAGADGWVLALALGDRPLPSEVVGAIHMGRARPIAFTNPVWIDGDGDGRVRAPGGPPPRPTPWGLLGEPKERGALEALLTPPLHAPLDCEPGAWADWAAGIGL